jgi:hypothetical protein
MTSDTFTRITGLVDPSPITGVCTFCGKVVVGKLNRVDNKTACDGCFAASSLDFLDERVLLRRGLVLGGVAALVYFLLLACLDVILDGVRGPSFMALPVGWIVGRTFALGSRGAPGFKFHMVPVVISYLSMALASVPVLIMHALNSFAIGQGWSTDVMVRLPLWALASPILVERSHGMMGMLSLLFLVAGLALAWRESGASPKTNIIR